jgi:hypothetical protein
VEAPAEAAPAPAEPAKPAEAAPAPAEPAKPAEAAPAPAEPAKPAEAAPVTHVVVAGDTYWDLAKKYYGDARKWRVIADANRGALAEGPDDRRDADHPAGELIVPAIANRARPARPGGLFRAMRRCVQTQHCISVRRLYVAAQRGSSR